MLTLRQTSPSRLRRTMSAQRVHTPLHSLDLCPCSSGDAGDDVFPSCSNCPGIWLCPVSVAISSANPLLHWHETRSRNAPLTNRSPLTDSGSSSGCTYYPAKADAPNPYPLQRALAYYRRAGHMRSVQHLGREGQLVPEWRGTTGNGLAFIGAVSPFGEIQAIGGGMFSNVK